MHPFLSMQEGETLDFRGALHRDGTVYSAVDPKDLSTQSDVRGG